MKTKHLDPIACLSIGEILLPVVLTASISMSSGIVLLFLLVFLAWPGVQLFRKQSSFIPRLTILLTWAVAAAAICVATLLLLASPELFYDSDRVARWDTPKIMAMLDVGTVVLIYLAAQRTLFLALLTVWEKKRGDYSAAC